MQLWFGTILRYVPNQVNPQMWCQLFLAPQVNVHALSNNDPGVLEHGYRARGDGVLVRAPAL